MTYNGAGSLFALGIRVTKLDANGAPLAGARNSYVSDALVQAQLGLEYEDGDEIVQKNGAGLVCLTYKAPDSLKRGTIEGLQICQPDPNLLAFMVGGTVLMEGGNEVGYQAPEVGTDPTPNGVSVELWTNAIIDGAQAGYFWWVVPRAKLRPNGSLTLSGTDPLVPELSGTCTQNANWLDGPANDWEFASDRVWQFVQTDTLPDFTRGFRAVQAQQTVASLAVTPDPGAATVGGTQQMTATATLTPSGTKVVTTAAVWTSSDESVATVDNGGLVTGVAAGTANITATYAGQSDTVATTIS
jgi:uncharacterized protein YjdB